MYKQEMILSLLESMRLDPVVLTELKQYRVQDENSAQPFILAVNRALRREMRSAFNDWGYIDSLGMGLWFTGGLILAIDACFSIDTLNETLQNATEMTAILLTGGGSLLHHVRRQFIREHSVIISDILLHFYSSLQMTRWRQRQAQQDIVQCLEDWEFDDKTVTLLKKDWIEFAGKPRRNTAKLESFLKHILAARPQFEAKMRATGEAAFESLILSGTFFGLSGGVLLHYMSRYGVSWENILLIGGVAFFYYNVRRRSVEKMSRSHALAEWDIQMIDRGLALLSGKAQPKAVEPSRLLPSAVGKSEEGRSSIRPARRLMKKMRLPKTRICTAKLKWVVFRLGYIAAAMPVWGYQCLMSVLQSASLRTARQLSAEKAFQEIMAAKDQPVRKLPEVPRRKLSKPQPRKKISRSIQAPPPSLAVQEQSDEPLFASTMIPDFVQESALPSQDEKLSMSPPSLEKSSVLHALSDDALSESALVPVSGAESVLLTFPQVHPGPLPPGLIFSPEEEKTLLIQRARLAERAFQLQYGRALGAEEYIRYLQGQLAQVTHAAHYWQWQATSLWGRLFSPPRPAVDSPLPGIRCGR